MMTFNRHLAHYAFDVVQTSTSKKTPYISSPLLTHISQNVLSIEFLFCQFLQIYYFSCASFGFSSEK